MLSRSIISVPEFKILLIISPFVLAISRRFLKSLEIEINFKKLGINQSKFINTLKNINQERLNNNPMLLSNLDLRDIYNFNSKY